MFFEEFLFSKVLVLPIPSENFARRCKKMRESVKLLLRRRELTTNPDQWRKIKRASSRAAQTAIRRLADAGRSELGL